MPLNLNEFIKQDDVIEYNGEKYTITALLPREMLERFSEISVNAASFSSDNPSPENISKIVNSAREISIDILGIKNDKEKVKSFIDSLPLNLLLVVFQYIGKFLSEPIDDKKKQD